jgi:HEAT repeat protein
MLSALVAALDDSDASVRSAAAAALASLGSDEAIEPLRLRISVEESIHARAAMQRAVEKLGGEKTREEKSRGSQGS